MKQKVMIGFCLLLLTSCAAKVSQSQTTAQVSSEVMEVNDFTLSPIVDTFDFDALNDLQYTFDVDAGEISFLSGHNIVASDYDIISQSIYIRKHYLAYLLPGEYELNVHSTTGKSKITFTILDKHNEYRVINHSFETGDLFGWYADTIFKGERNLLAFTDDSVITSGDPYSEPYTVDGDYLVGPITGESRPTFEEKMGTLRSSTFTLGGSGFITYRLGIGRVADLAHVSIHRAKDNVEIARYSQRNYHIPNSPTKYGAMALYKADLSAYVGEKLYVVVHDCGGHSDECITFDALNTYYETEPPLETSEAINEIPIFPLNYAPNQLPNGDFTQGLDMWQVSPNLGWQDTSAFHVEDGILKSNVNGDVGRGLIRSSLFTIDGSGYASLKLGAAKGARFDKDTYVSVRLHGSNKEIFRFANEKHDGTNMIEYFIDLSNYIGKKAYFEVVDNATNSWDVIFVSDIKTYYGSVPDLTTANHARNLNY
ncbi:MAG: hypothetical protein BWX74_00628 [Tenericutes bacterium ADurb.Bin087]|nr:MAG: hypothetical protein BWX74_00628 [Tenericutes bacterium ADurb.Bin087]